MFRHSLLSAMLATGICLIAETASAQSAAQGRIQVYPPGTNNGYYQRAYPNYFLPQTAYQLPGTSGTQTSMGPQYYIPPYAPEYPYTEPTSQRSLPDPASSFPYDTGSIGAGLRGRDPGNVPEVQANFADTAILDSRARVQVHVPANAVVWFEGAQTQATGTVRDFQSPNLTPGDRYVYTIRARWSQDGREVTQSQRVDVAAGSQIQVKFSRPASTPAAGVKPSGR